jgi:hypothetical protein
MPGNDPIQSRAFDDRETLPPRTPEPIRWVCARCGSGWVRPDPATPIDPRYTTGTCRACKRKGDLIRHA